MAKILMCKRVDGAWGYITDGLVNALTSIGHEVLRYDGTIEQWQAFGPDLYVGCSGHQQLIPTDRGECKVAIHVNPYGPHVIQGFTVPGRPVSSINEPPKTIEWVLAQRPDLVFGYGANAQRELWSYWDGNGVQWVPLPTAGDITKYSPNFDQYDSRDLDLVYVGGRWTYKAETIDRFLIPVLRKSKLSYEAWGHGQWPNTIVHKGTIAEDAVPALFRRAKIAPCISEPHTLVWGIDLPERVFKTVLSGAVAVHDPAADLQSYLPSVTACFDEDDYFSTIKMISRWSADRRLDLAKKQYLEVVGAHTYHHRVAKLFSALGWAVKADEAVKAVDGHIDASCRQLQV